ncbi:uncharacterized protein [Aegilops tauschii subsp. strangulata]|uniref:uncharacterized protein n=1 Tax=Aegilops tauschii subsp. strangulata TaxID=200361 RepID=UPI003CC878FF
MKGGRRREERERCAGPTSQPYRSRPRVDPREITWISGRSFLIIRFLQSKAYFGLLQQEPFESVMEKSGVKTRSSEQTMLPAEADILLVTDSSLEEDSEADDQSYYPPEPFQLEGVMAVSVGVKTRSSEKIVLPVDAYRTTVVLAQEPAPTHITQTHTDCTPTQLDREPATPLLTPTLADSNPVPVDTAPSPPQSTQTRAVSKATAAPKARGQPLRTPSQRLKQKKNCSQNMDKILEKSTPLCNGKGSNADKVQDSETSLLVSKKADKNYIEDTETTPKSCLDVVFELLATTAGTSSSNSLPESFWLLESQLQVERHQSDVMRQEAEGLRKSLQNLDAYFLVQQQVLDDLRAKQEKVNKLAKHLASIMGTSDIVS